MTDGEDLEEHIRKMRDWYQQINDISPGSITEADWITTLVASLPDSWDSFTQSVDFKFNLSDKNALANQVADLRARIMAEAHRRHTRSDTGKAFFSTTKPGYNKFMRPNIPNRPNNHSHDKSNTKCNNCGRMGHWAAECRQPGGGAYKANQQHRPNKGNAPNRHFNPPARHKNRDSKAHIAFKTPTEDDNFSFQASDQDFALLNQSGSAWVADSGSTTHIARSRNAFSDCSIASGTVTGVTGKEPILGRGTVKLCCLINAKRHKYGNITLTDVAHVPSSPTNLISLSLVTDRGFRVSMEKNYLKISSPNGQIVALGAKSKDRISGNLWHMRCDTISAETQFPIHNRRTEAVFLKQTGRTWYEWHKILGHVGPQALQHLKNTNAVSGMEVIDGKEGLSFECEACIQAKAHTRPFPKESSTIVKDIGELVVTDVWGPAKTNSIGRYRYYVSFTDVATRYTRLGFLRHKDETLDEYKLFEAMLNTQLNKKIKKVRFDNGGEFVNKDWQEHTSKTGTILETTAPYSAQQNGIAERLNCTLTDKARAMLIESAAPKFLWSEAIAYACYLKNRVPTQVHGKYWKTPFEAFWGKKPDVSNLRPWGTKCYVLNQGENQSKLNPKTFQALFTGISDVQGKSWRYYKSGAKRILHSRNITFPRNSTAIGGDPNDYDLGDTVVPPAEGEEMTQKDIAAKRQEENAKTGGEKSEIKPETQPEQKDIKAEPQSEQTASKSSSHSTATKSTSAPTIKPTTSRSKPSMMSPATSSSTPSTPTGCVLRSNPGQPMLSLEKERGGIEIKVVDGASGQHNTRSKNASAHLVTDDEVASYCSDDKFDVLDSWSVISDNPLLTEDEYEVLASSEHPARRPLSPISELNEEFGQLNVSEFNQPFPPPSLPAVEVEDGEPH
ncbi:hypothetical protein FRC07_008629 [Ceratobasidium sp. 392]|nr:hypothetical protein FRC07_008629 [Ceratobasidium sp. 392]